ncbi:MAG: ATP-binding protein [Candidatus Zixiibacteriota bacterium]
MANRLFERMLKAEPEGDTLLGSLKAIRSRAEPLLARIVETFPEYTTHDIRHSEAVLACLRWVVPPTLHKRLNPYEVFFLIASAYVHDIGMVDLAEFRDEGETETARKKQARAEEIRENHHLRTETYIVKNFKDLSIPDVHQARIIGRISRGHRKENLHDKSVYKPDAMYKDHSINVPLLAACLRIADELDLTFERAPLIIYEHIPPKDTISKVEWEKHLSVSGVGISPEDTSLIKCSASCENPKIHRVLKRLETKINKELEDYPNHLHHYRDVRKNLPRKFMAEIEAEGYKTYDFKFSLLEKEIVSLLMGEKLYQRKQETLRELLKNSVDGCRLRRELVKKRGMTYKPEITFELTPGRARIVVTDNGVGMDEDIIERYLTKIGQSFYTSPEFLEQELDMTPVSELGVGILSCFMLAESIVIETRAEGCQPLLIEIDDIADYFVARTGSRRAIGTSVTLFLKEEVKDEIDLEAEMRHYARHLEFPIQVVLPDRSRRTIEDQGHQSEIKTVLGSLAEVEGKTWGAHVIKTRRSNVQGTIALILEQRGALGLVPAQVTSHVMDRLLLIGTQHLSNEGIFVGDTNVLPEGFRPALVVLDLDVRKKMLDLNVARNYVVDNDKLANFRKELERLLVRNLGRYLDVLQRNVKRAGVGAESLCNEFFASFVRDGPSLKRLWIQNELTQRFLDFVKRYFYYRSICTDGTRFLRHADIVDSGKPALLLDGLGLYADEHIQEMYRGCTGFKKGQLYVLREPNCGAPAEFLFENVRTKDFTSLFKFTELEELAWMLPRTWKIAKFENYRTSRFIEFRHPSMTLVSTENRFVALLLRHKHLIEGDRAMALHDFFTTFPRNLGRYFRLLVDKQREILRWFVEARLLGEAQVHEYLFTREDFPPHLMQWTYSGK